MILGKTSQWYPKKANMQGNIKITEFILGIQGYQYIHNYHVLYSLKSHYLLLKSYLQLVVYYLHLCQNHKNFIRESKHISWYKVRTTSYKLVCKSIFTYPLVNVYITMERSTILELGKSTISMAIFNSFLYVYQAGYIKGGKPPQLIDPSVHQGQALNSLGRVQARQGINARGTTVVSRIQKWWSTMFTARRDGYHDVWW